MPLLPAEPQPKEPLHYSQHQHHLVAHCHGEMERNAEDREDRSSMDIARRVGGHVALGSGEGRVDSRPSEGRLPTHLGHHNDHKKAVEDHTKAAETRMFLERKRTGCGWCDNQLEDSAELHSPHLLPCEMVGIEIDPGMASSVWIVETVCPFRRSWALLPRAGATFPDSASLASSFLSNAGDP